tara:strand:- start:35 stop:322 length:288 start_codon:yes stop_codon:yes gene_type:complete
MGEEEKQVEETTEEESSEEDDSSSNTKTLVERAEKAAANLKAENDRRKEIIDEERVRTTLSGKSDAGQIAEVPKEETPTEYAQRVSGNDLKDGEG